LSTQDQYTAEDRKWMRKALDLAAQGAGYVSPNPMVGCVIVSDDGRLIGKGYHEHYGQAHAEINALNSVTDKTNLVDATAYVTLEPCSHHGKTPPCAAELGKLPLKRVVVAMEDPNPEVNGDGIRHLKDKGIQVDVGLLEEQARDLNEFFLHYMTFMRPFVTLKMAQTADGYIAAPDGDSEWISSDESRVMVHQWRSVYDAVLIGHNTAQLDNPRLTVRHVEGRQPYRVVIDGDYELPRNLNLFTDQYEEKTIVITHRDDKISGEDDPMLNILQPNYFRGKTIVVPKRSGHSDLNKALHKLGDMGITSVLVEAGQDLASAMLAQDLVDKLELFISPKLLGGGTRSIMGLGINHMSEIRKLRSVSWQQIGDDMLMSAYL